MNSLNFENVTASKGPAVHALIVGVGGYPHLPKQNDKAPSGGWPVVKPTLGLVQLESAVQSAVAFAELLLELGVNGDATKPRLSRPLGSMHVLLSPTEAELGAQPTLATYEPATLQNLQSAAMKWRSNASCHADNITLFYFAGHGVQRRLGDHVLLLHDFGRPTPRLLESSVNVNNILGGMRPSASQKNIALKQITLLDACRAQPDVFDKYEQAEAGVLWDVEEEADRGTDPRIRPLVHSTSPGKLAFGKERRSFFCEALLKCLEGGAAIPPATQRLDNFAPEWRVTFNSLFHMIGNIVSKIGAESGHLQQVQGDFLGADFDIGIFPTPPPVEIVIQLQPPNARKCTHFIFSNGNNDVLHVNPPISEDKKNVISSGWYIVTVNTDLKLFVEQPPKMLSFLPPRIELPLHLNRRDPLI